MSKFKVGDRVIVRDWSTDEEERLDINPQYMREFKGREATVVEVIQEHAILSDLGLSTQYPAVRLDIDRGAWKWHEGALTLNTMTDEQVEAACKSYLRGDISRDQLRRILCNISTND